MPSMSEEPLQVVDRLVRHYNAQELEDVVDAYAEDAVVESGGTFRGRDAIREHFRGLREMFGDATLEKREAHVAGEVVVLELLHHVRPPGASAEATLPMAMVFRVRGGLVRENRAYVEAGSLAGFLAASAAEADAGERAAHAER